MQHYFIELSDIRDRDSLHCRLKSSLPLPDYYGGNLDALYDWLTALPETAIEFHGFRILKENLDTYADAFVLALTDAAAQNPRLDIILK